MKLWKILVKNSHVYNRDNQTHNSNNMTLYAYKSVRSSDISEDSGKYLENQLFDDDNHIDALFKTTVQLKKNHDESFGIIVGNSDLGSSPIISSLRPDSVASQSDQLLPGDRIQSINTVSTCKMRPNEVNSILENIDGNAFIEIGYNLPNYGSQNSLSITTKSTDVVLERADGSIGITLRGGAVLDRPNLSRPLIVTHVRPNGPAARTGLIRVGDRVLKVDNISLSNKTLMEAQQILKDSCVLQNQHGVTITTLTIEYEVNNMESVKYANGPLLVEIDRCLDDNFGVVLNSNNINDFGLDGTTKTGYFVGHIIPGSTADRCGALNVGDQLLAIDDVKMENFLGSIADIDKLLMKARRLQILPFHALQRFSKNYGYGHVGNNSPSLSSVCSTMNSKRSKRKHLSNRQSFMHKSFESDLGNCYGYLNHVGVCHTETLNLILYSERETGYGIQVTIGEPCNNKAAEIVISRIVPDSSAYRCGCLQPGDRILTINHQHNLTFQEVQSILDRGNDSIGQISLQIEFDVADTIVPSSGIFTVKLARKTLDLGITITSSKVTPDDPFIISEIRRGSIAHRTGTLHAGDRLLAIDNIVLNHHNVESTFEVIKNSKNEIVTLKIEKIETENNNLFLDSVVYTVELHRYGGPLGITISGSEDTIEPIILSRIAEGGLAEKTGALHAGDRILAINKESLEHKRLSDAIRLLQNSSDRVQLKIARNLKVASEAYRNSNCLNLNLDERCDYSSPDGVMSIDSAVHSWDSNHPDNAENNEGEENLMNDHISRSFDDTPAEQHDSQIQFYSDAEDIFCPSPLPLPNYNYSNSYKYDFHHQASNYEDSLVGHDIFHVTLYKDSVYDDYGFSVSDGLYEKGVYVNKIRTDGPADIVGLLKPYDRIIQVNDTKTQDFDCCLTVPLIASAGDRIELVVARNPYINNYKNDKQEMYSKRISPNNHHTITKTL